LRLRVFVRISANLALDSGPTKPSGTSVRRAFERVPTKQQTVSAVRAHAIVHHWTKAADLGGISMEHASISQENEVTLDMRLL